jgi:hypothetical protein
MQDHILAVSDEEPIITPPTLNSLFLEVSHYYQFSRHDASIRPTTRIFILNTNTSSSKDIGDYC